MILTFKGGSEIVVYELDRKNKIFYFISSRTNNIRTLMEWKYLFDKGKEQLQETISDKLSDSLFIEVIVDSMKLNGYALVSKC